MELDFDTDAEDIMISGAPKIAQTNNTSKMLIQNHIANRFRYSLRVYSSILYLHLPENFRISLRGRVVEPHRMVNDLKFRECIKYKPQVGGNIEPTVITTIGFLEGSPCLNIHGFNVYHKNRLILPFWPVFSNSNGKCRGVAGVLEVNFLKPTHDKQDFEKSNLYQKLETRLKDMAVEYWDYHCHLVGYPAKKNPPPPARTSSPAHQVPHLGTFNGVQQVMLPSLQLPCSGTPSDIRTVTENPSSFTVNIPGAAFIAGASQTAAGNPPHLLAGRQVVTALSAPTCSTPGQFFTTSSASSQTVPRKRRHENSIDAAESLKKPAMAGEIAAGLGINQKNQLERGGKGWRIQKLITMILENKKLQSQCLEFEKVEKQLLLKEQTLRNELQVVQQLYKDLLVELESMDEMKLEK